jgi:hypothetical protein
MAAAVSDVSFRMLGLGKGLADIVSDEYTDFNLFPALVVDMTGTTLFTNLGNLGSAVRTLDRSGATSPDADYFYPEATNVVGLITDAGSGKAGFLVEDGRYKIESENSSQESLTYPEQNISSVRLTAFGAWTHLERAKTTEESRFRDMSAFYGTTLENGSKVAIRVSRVAAGGAITTETQSRNYRQYPWYTEDKTRLKTTTSQEESTSTRLEAGAAFDSGDWVVDLAAALGPERTTSETLKTVHRELHQDWVAELGAPLPHDDGGGESPLLSNDVTRDRTKDDSSETDLQVGRLRARASRPVTIFGKEALGRLFADFSTGNGSLDGSLSKDRVKITEEAYGDAIKRTIESSSSLREFTGDIDVTAMGAGGGVEVSLGEQTRLGLGLKLASEKGKAVIKLGGRTRHQTTTSETIPLENGGPQNAVPGTPDVHDRAYNDPSETVVETDNFTLSIPVGIEHRLTDRLTLRLGSEAFLVDVSKINGTQKGTDAPDTVDGQTQNGATDAWENSSTSEASFTHAVYSAGFGYQLSENVQLDAVHVTNLVDLANWLVSVTIKF